MKSVEAARAQTYHRVQIETAPIAHLVCMLHDQCALHLRLAMRSDSPLRRRLLDRVQNILVLLQRSLDPIDAPAKSLYHLYDYCYCLCEHESPTELGHAASIINTLRKTFNELKREG